MPDNPRIEELRRRVHKDPASIAFAQLAEEYRRAGQYDEAIDVAKAGLQQHPAYLSARVTLGRALIELGRLDEAAAEFEYVVRAAPDNLTAVRQLADIHQRRRQASNETKSREAEGTASPPVIPPRAAPTVPPVAAPLIPPVAAIGAVVQPAPRMPAAAMDLDVSLQPHQPEPASEDPVLRELDAWLAVLVSERTGRGPSDAGHR